MNRVLSILALTSLLIAGPVYSTPPIEFNKILSSNIAVKKQSEKSRDSTVKVLTRRGHGSGTIVKFNGDHYILTAKHVVKKSKIVIIESYSETSVGEVIYMAKDLDLAFIKIGKVKNKRTPKIKILKKKPKIGSEVVYSGYPSGYNMFTAGGHVASYQGARILLQGFAWPGSSGAGVLNEDGELIGVLIAVGASTVANNYQLIETVVKGNCRNECTLTS